ncbi:MAG: YihY/virulence factor BrkB family protein [Deltaproteobacteria bacterium]
MKRRLRVLWELIVEAVDGYSRHRGDLLAAALAFHALLSIAPLVIIAVAIAGVVLGTGAAQLEMTRVLHDAIGKNGASTVNGWVQQASESGGLASLVGIVLTVFTASRFGDQLRSALNQSWNIDVYMAQGFRLSVQDYLQRRAFAFLLALGAGPLLLAVFASRMLLTGFHQKLFAASAWQGVEVQLLQLGFSWASVALIIAVVFRFVPDTRIAWRNALVGGAVTSFAFNLGNALVGLYLGRASVTAAYGAAGSLVVVLLWLYFSAQAFLIGAEFTRAFAERFGSRLSVTEQRELELVQQTSQHH